ncbi:MAG: HEAT repeat domain-containing protein [Phycisphaerales bacterium]|nr:MAG: HEAT repeat domain-containing protein [Phycisphaerales bacterium]
MNRSPGTRVALRSIPLLGLFQALACTADRPVGPFGTRDSDTRTNRQLTVALDSDQPDERRKALLSLIYEPAARSPEAYQALDLIARTDQNDAVRRAAIAVLAQYEDDRPAETLLRLLHAEDHRTTVRPVNDAIRWDAVTALGGLAERGVIPAARWPEVVRTLTTLLYDSADHHVQVSAARALRHFFCRESITALAGALSARDFGVAYEARASLRYMTGLQEDMGSAAWQEWLYQANVPPASSLHADEQAYTTADQAGGPQ